MAREVGSAPCRSLVAAAFDTELASPSLRTMERPGIKLKQRNRQIVCCANSWC